MAGPGVGTGEGQAGEGAGGVARLHGQPAHGVQGEGSGGGEQEEEKWGAGKGRRACAETQYSVRMIKPGKVTHLRDSRGSP